MTLHILNIFAILLLFYITWYKEISWLLTLQFSLCIIAYSGGLVNELGKQLVNNTQRDFPGGLMVKTRSFHRRGTGSILFGELRSCMTCCMAKKNKNKKQANQKTPRGG